MIEIVVRVWREMATLLDEDPSSSARTGTIRKMVLETVEYLTHGIPGY